MLDDVLIFFLNLKFFLFLDSTFYNFASTIFNNLTHFISLLKRFQHSQILRMTQNTKDQTKLFGIQRSIKLYIFIQLKFNNKLSALE